MKKYEKGKDGWDEMLELLYAHPAVGYRLALTKTWYPGQEVIFSDDEGEKLSFSGHDFLGAVLDEESWVLTVQLPDGESVEIELDGRKNDFETLAETIGFMLSDGIAIPDSCGEYTELEIGEDSITLTETAYPQETYSIDEGNFKKAHIFRNLDKLRIELAGNGITFFDIPFEEVDAPEESEEDEIDLEARMNALVDMAADSKSRFIPDEEIR